MLLRQRLLKLLRVLLKVGLNFLKSLVTMIGKDRDLDDANYTKETRR